MANRISHRGLGIGHSNVAGATMNPPISARNTAPRTHASDDIAGKNDLY